MSVCVTANFSLNPLAISNLHPSNTSGRRTICAIALISAYLPGLDLFLGGGGGGGEDEGKEEVGSFMVGEGVEAAASHSATERDHMVLVRWWGEVGLYGGGFDGWWGWMKSRGLGGRRAPHFGPRKTGSKHAQTEPVWHAADVFLGMLRRHHLHHCQHRPNNLAPRTQPTSVAATPTSDLFFRIRETC